MNANLKLADRIAGFLGPFHFITRSERDLIVTALRGAVVRLEARRASGSDWVEIYPSQLEWVAKAGHQVRAVEIGPELTSDFTKSLPGGAIDDTTFSQIEVALDAIEAPITDADGRYLTLVERIQAVARRREK